MEALRYAEMLHLPNDLVPYFNKPFVARLDLWYVWIHGRSESVVLLHLRPNWLA